MKGKELTLHIILFISFIITLHIPNLLLPRLFPGDTVSYDRELILIWLRTIFTAITIIFFNISILLLIFKNTKNKGGNPL